MSGEPVLALDARLELGEGPVWDDREQCLLFVDIERGEIHRFEPRTGAATTVAHVDGTVGAVALTRSGRLLAAAGTRLWLDGTPVAEATDADARVVRFNDGAVDPAGRFWAGTMALDESPGHGTLYRFGEGSLTAAVAPVSISNGIDWTLDGTQMYYADSTEQRVDVFDFDPESGSLSGREPFAEIDPVDGAPDGLTVDAEGHLWLALWDGWALRRYRPDGTLERIVELPVSRVTSCAFGGDDLRDLYVTSARTGLSEAELRAQAQAGGLFVLRPGVAGRAANRFAD
jgi:sugar lactone lactonase YvrE